jgi:hypothetical protein
MCLRVKRLKLLSEQSTLQLTKHPKQEMATKERKVTKIYTEGKKKGKKTDVPNLEKRIQNCTRPWKMVTDFPSCYPGAAASQVEALNDADTAQMTVSSDITGDYQ